MPPPLPPPSPTPPLPGCCPRPVSISRPSPALFCAAKIALGAVTLLMMLLVDLTAFPSLIGGERNSLLAVQNWPEPERRTFALVRLLVLFFCYYYYYHCCYHYDLNTRVFLRVFFIHVLRSMYFIFVHSSTTKIMGRAKGEG